MYNTLVASHIIGSIIKEGNNILHDKQITRQKMPIYTNRRVQLLNKGLINHVGYGAQGSNKNSCLTMKKDQMPKNIRRDLFSSHTIDVVNTDKQKNPHLHPPTLNHKPTYNIKNQLTSTKTKALKRANTLQLKQKENNFIKLWNDQPNRTLVGRIKQHQQNQEESIRQSKRQSLVREYQQKQLLQAKKVQKDQRINKLQLLLQSHTQKGLDHKFTFDISGDLLIFKQETDKFIKKNYPPKTRYQVQRINTKKSDTNFTTQTQHKSNHQSHFDQNQKIKTARGLAFASSVMKTVNLSRISMNGSLNNVQDQSFMQRNDLFNNNHSRQTTNVPYFELKNGTVYTQLTTNQVVFNPNNTTQNKQQLVEKCTKSFYTISPKDKLQPFQKTSPKMAVNHINILDQKESGDCIINSKPNSIFQNKNQNKQQIVQKRPKTCRTGRIITVNKQLAISLLK